MRVSDVVNVCEELAPTSAAESWDNVGLLVGDPSGEVSRLLLAIDYTAGVAEEARELGADFVYAYHPPIFSGLKTVKAGTLVFDAIRRGVALYSPHTALDVAEGGTNDVLADALGMTDRAPLKLGAPKDSQLKLVTFVPEEALARVAGALAAAGAGKTFHARSEGAVKLETVVPIARLEEALRALRGAHPYEEPAFDLVRLAAPPEKKGIGRVGSVHLTRREAVERVKQALGLSHVLVAGPLEGPARKAAVCAGACGELLDEALKARVDVYLTGELRHHDALKAASKGVTVIATLHSNSERAVLARVRERLLGKLAGVEVHVSRRDRDVFRVT